MKKIYLAKERFWEKVNIGKKDVCWEWSASLDGKGYGQISICGKPKRAHRVAWILKRGEIPENKFVCHHCDNRKCVNPNHLFIGGPLSNIQDMDRKGRRINTPHHGEKHGMAILTNYKVKIIKFLLKNTNLKQNHIAKTFQVSNSTINHIKKNRQWVGI